MAAPVAILVRPRATVARVLAMRRREAAAAGLFAAVLGSAAVSLSLRGLPPTGSMAILLGILPETLGRAWTHAIHPLAGLAALPAWQAGLVVLALAAGIAAAYALIAWLLSPFAVMDEPFGDTFWRAVRIIAMLPVSLPLPLAGAALVVQLAGLDDSAGIRDAGGISWLVYAHHTVLIAGVAGLAWTLAVWLRALATPPLHHLPPQRSPTCEVCGYDIRGIELSANCPECGQPIAASLGPDVRRPCVWERGEAGASAGAFLRTAAAVTFRPTAFFRRLRAWESVVPARRFALMTVALVGAVTAFVLARLLPPPYGSADVAFHVLLGLAVFFAGIGVVCVPPAVAAGYDLVRGRPNRQLPATKTACYLAVWMVPAALVNLPISILLIHGDHRLRELASRLNLPLTGYDARDLLLLLINFAIIGLWLRQYVRGYEAMRHANR